MKTLKTTILIIIVILSITKLNAQKIYANEVDGIYTIKMYGEIAYTTKIIDKNNYTIINRFDANGKLINTSKTTKDKTANQIKKDLELQLKSILEYKTIITEKMFQYAILSKNMTDKSYKKQTSSLINELKNLINNLENGLTIAKKFNIEELNPIFYKKIEDSCSTSKDNINLCKILIKDI